MAQEIYIPYNEGGERTVRESHGHGDYLFTASSLTAGKHKRFWETQGEPSSICLISAVRIKTTFLRRGGEECEGVAVGYLYRCIVMNEALECSPNYTHTRSSTIRSHVHASD